MAEKLVLARKYHGGDFHLEAPSPGSVYDAYYYAASDYDALAAELAAAEKQWNVDVEARGKLLNRVAELETALANEKGGWDAFYKLRKSVGEGRYPGVTGEVKASAAETEGKE